MGLDLAIPEKYGIYQSVGDTVGPGGLSRALRNVPVMTGIAQAMDRRCPDAWMLNLTNPMTVLTRIVGLSAPRLKVVGLCHELFGVRGGHSYPPAATIPRPRGRRQHPSGFTAPDPSSTAASKMLIRLRGVILAFAEMTFPRTRTGVSRCCPSSAIRVGCRRSS